MMATPDDKEGSLSNVEAKRDDDGSSSSVQATLTRLRQHGLQVKAHPSSTRHKSLRRASVLVLLSNDHQILLTQRSRHLRSHPGEVCFPGGKQDEADAEDDWKTALREAKEEVGLDLEQAGNSMEKLARLRTIESINHLCVTPMVGFMDEAASSIDQRIRVNPSEVQHSFWAPLSFFLDAKPEEEYDIPWQGEVFVFRNYMFELGDTGSIPITGLTAHIARQVAEIGLAPTSETSSLVRTSTKEFHGVLWRKQEGTGTSKASSWVRRYFLLSNGVLHQYDNRQSAERKSRSASKKNRLRLQSDTSVQMVDLDPCTESGRFPFEVSVLEARIVWTVAAASEEERSHWKRRIVENI